VCTSRFCSQFSHLGPDIPLCYALNCIFAPYGRSRFILSSLKRIERFANGCFALHKFIYFHFSDFFPPVGGK
ncbi:MAG: hypothetical protein ABF291_06925, partial [Desulfobacterales bacterium]